MSRDSVYVEISEDKLIPVFQTWYHSDLVIYTLIKGVRAW
jgi:hypothetical protein